MLCGLFTEQQDDRDLCVTVTMDCGFERMLLHGVAEYHNLVSVSVNTDDGERQTFIRSSGHRRFVHHPQRLSEVLVAHRAPPMSAGGPGVR